MSRFLSIPIVGSPAQAITQIQARLDAIFGRRRVDLEYVHDNDSSTLVELIVVLTDDLPEEDVRAFRRALENIKGRLGTAVEVPVGAGGTVSSAIETQFPIAGAPAGFVTVGNVTIAGGQASGPNTIHTDGGTGDTLDLSTAAITSGLPIQPGTLVIETTIGASSELIIDDGVGNLTGATALPGGGTINYTTGAMTGTTAALDASSTVTETHTTNISLSPPLSVKLDSGAIAGSVSLGVTTTKAIGRPPAALEWSFNINFAPDFGLNNNGVTGAQALALEARLIGLISGRDVVMRWTASTDDTTPPIAWSTPSFVVTTPGSAPTAALAIDMDAAYHQLVFRKVGPKTLGVSYDGVEEIFVFAEDIVVPSSISVTHDWGAALDRYFTIDDWSLSYAFPSPA